MKRFSFKFNRLQKIRERNEKAALLRLSLAQTDLAREEKLLTSLVRAVEDSGAQLSCLLRDGAPAGMLRNADAFRGSTSAAAGRQEEATRRAAEAAAEKRQECRQARQKAEAIRKLNEKSRKEHRKGWLREMQKELDEVGGRTPKTAEQRQAHDVGQEPEAR